MFLKNCNYRRLTFAFIVSIALTPPVLRAHPSTAVPSERTEVADMAELSRCEKPLWPHKLPEEQKGRVEIAFLVDIDGKVIDSIVRKSSKYEPLDTAARNGILKCRFKPKLVNGNPVARWMLMSYKFIMPGGYAEPTAKMLLDRRKALEGDLNAFYELALAIQSEFADDSQALEMFRAAAGRGHAGAIYQIADAMWHGTGVPMNQPKALGYFMSAAELGHAEAEYEIGMAYANGVGVMPNAAKAQLWLRKAAEQHNYEAQVALGDLLAAQVDGQPDYGAIAAFYSEAAVAGDALAQLRLAQCHLSGAGVKKDLVQAAAWLRKAAEQRLPRAESLLGSLYLEGAGVPIDSSEANKLLLRAAAGGEPTAMRRLASIAQTPNEAKAWLQKAQQADPTTQPQPDAN